MLGRRDLLRGIGATATGAAIFSDSVVGRVRGSPDKSSITEIGLQDVVMELLNRGKLQRLSEILEEYNIENNYKTQAVRFETNQQGNLTTTEVEESEGDFTAQDYFETSNFAGGVYKWDEDIYAVINAANLDGATIEGNYDVDRPSPRDVATVGWEGDIFGPAGNTKIESTLTFSDGFTLDMNPEYVNKPNDPSVGSYPNGYIVSFDDTRRGLEGECAKSAYALFQTTLRKQSDYQGRIVPKYTHTWSPFDIARFNILDSISLDIGGAGISVDVPTGADSYSIGQPYEK